MEDIIKTREEKTTHCELCGTEIKQWKKEGILFCPSCKNKYVEYIEQNIKKAFPDNKFYVDVDTYNRFGNNSNKHTKITFDSYNEIKQMTVLIETEKLLKMFFCESLYTYKYIEAQTNAAYWYIKSIYEKNKKDTDKIFFKFLPLYQAGKLTLKEFASSVCISKKRIEDKLKEIE